jgi:hypothetical protein
MARVQCEDSRPEQRVRVQPRTHRTSTKNATGKGRSRPHPSTQRDVLALLCIPEEDLSPVARAQRMLRVPPQFSASGNSTDSLTSNNADYFVVLNTIGEAFVQSGTRRVDDHAFAEWSAFCGEMSVSPWRRTQHLILKKWSYFTHRTAYPGRLHHSSFATEICLTCHAQLSTST